MLFSSVTFLCLFLPATLAVYFLVPRTALGGRARNFVLLAASLLFYFFGEPVYTLLLLFSSVSDWLHGIYIEKHRGQKSAKYALISAVVINLLLLGFFKYIDFLIGIVNGIFGTSIPLTGVPLPLGISFFTFQTMSYSIDVYRGNTHARADFATFATYVCLFPQLVAGPIVRYSDVESELAARETGLEQFAAGARRFVFGLAKKVIIANSMGELCSVFRASDEKSILFYWLYAVAYMFQIYYDFSGYSDMAIGLGRIFGFNFPENFNYPYISRSVTEFWRRWHMTLGGWFRDYVYIPLGGNRVSRVKWIRNILVVWFLTGMWHGAEWNFIAWGVMYGILLLVEKLWVGKVLERSPRIVGHVWVIVWTLLGFVLFNANGLSGAVEDIGGMFGAGGIPLVSGEVLYYLRSYALLLAFAAVGSVPLLRKLALRYEDSGAMTLLEPVSCALMLLASTASIVNGSFNPFLYFRF